MTTPKKVVFGLLFLLVSSFCLSMTYYVDDDAPNDPGPGDCAVSDPLEDGSQSHPFDAIQETIDIVDVNDVVLVQTGVYYENLVFPGIDFVLTSSNPQDETVVSNTIIDGNDLGRVVSFAGTESSSCILTGLTIYNGYCRTFSPTDVGGGIFGNNATATISNCIISENSAYEAGGGIALCDGLIEKCIIDNNHSGGAGAIHGCAGVIRNCTITNNHSYNEGGGPGSSGGTITSSNASIESCIVSNNVSASGGTIIYCHGSISNCIISGNSIQRYDGELAGGGAGIRNCDAKITNCTITGNRSYAVPGLVGCSGVIENCISVSNISINPSGSQVNSCPQIRFSCFEDGSGNGNIDTNPLFARQGYWDDNWTSWDYSDDFWVEGDYRLQPGSPCVDTGDPNYIAEPGETDLDGNHRIINGVVDMGAYECPEDIYVDIIYVDQKATSGANNGSSWEDAFLDFQTALDIAASYYSQIWVAAGTYYPTSNYGLAGDDPNRLKHFRMVNGVVIYGGFPPGGGLFSSRDPNQYETILSGDLLGNDDSATALEELLYDPNRADNCYHVFFHPNDIDLESSAILDGFTITAGNANIGDWPEETSCGGGMYNKSSNPTVTNCTFSGNTVLYGGGMFNYSSSPTVTNCTFSGNSARYGGSGGGMYNYGSSPSVTNCMFSGNRSYGSGGGMDNWNNSSPTVTACTFSGNTTLYGGGGMRNVNNSSPTVTDCTFSGNRADGGGGMRNFNSSPVITNCTFSGNRACGGGGIINLGNSSPSVAHCTFSNNTAGGCSSWNITPGCGGGMFNWDNSSPTVSHCTFSNNTVSSAGGGMCNYENSSPTVTHCTFSGNTAIWGGGMSNDSYSSPAVINCTFSGNTANFQIGGGMDNWSNSSPMVTNCTFTGNTASKGGGMSNYDNSLPVVTNCILWANSATETGDEIYNDSSDPNFMYCDIAGSGGSAAWDSLFGTDGGGNIDADPMFVDPNGVDGVIGTEDDNLRLSSSSPCIDAGDNSVVTEPNDLEGRDRIVDGDCDGTATVDMGAYEFGWVYIGDFAGGCDVDLSDFAVFASAWMTASGDVNYNGLCDISIPADNSIDENDLIIFVANWLEGT